MDVLFMKKALIISGLKEAGRIKGRRIQELRSFFVKLEILSMPLTGDKYKKQIYINFMTLQFMLLHSGIY